MSEDKPKYVRKKYIHNKQKYHLVGEVINWVSVQ